MRKLTEEGKWWTKLQPLSDIPAWGVLSLRIGRRQSLQHPYQGSPRNWSFNQTTCEYAKCQMVVIWIVDSFFYMCFALIALYKMLKALQIHPPSLSYHSHILLMATFHLLHIIQNQYFNVYDIWCYPILKKLKLKLLSALWPW